MASAATAAGAMPVLAAHGPRRPTPDRPPPAKDLVSYEEVALAFRCHEFHLEMLDRPITPLGSHYVLMHFDIPALAAENYRLRADGSAGFAVGRYDRGHPLMIATAPGVGGRASAAPRLAYSAFLGGTNRDELHDVDVDRTGHGYVTGITMSPDFPAQAAVQPRFGEVLDAVVARFAPDGRLLYSTYLGGEATDTGRGCA